MCDNYLRVLVAKNTTLAILANGLKTFRFVSIYCCKSCDLASASLICVACVLISLSESTNVLLSSSEPLELASYSSKRSYNVMSRNFNSSSFCKVRIFYASSSGCSCWMVMPKNWFYNPLRVIEKLMRVKKPRMSGATCISVDRVSR